MCLVLHHTKTLNVFIFLMMHDAQLLTVSLLMCPFLNFQNQKHGGENNSFCAVEQLLIKRKCHKNVADHQMHFNIRQR